MSKMAIPLAMDCFKNTFMHSSLAELPSNKVQCPILFCSVLFCSVQFCSVLFCSVLFCSVLFCSVLFCAVLFCSVLFCSVLFCAVLCCDVYGTIIVLASIAQGPPNSTLLPQTTITHRLPGLPSTNPLPAAERKVIHRLQQRPCSDHIQLSINIAHATFSSLTSSGRCSRT